MRRLRTLVSLLAVFSSAAAMLIMPALAQSHSLSSEIFGVNCESPAAAEVEIVVVNETDQSVSVEFSAEPGEEVGVAPSSATIAADQDGKTYPEVFANDDPNDEVIMVVLSNVPYGQKVVEFHASVNGGPDQLLEGPFAVLRDDCNIGEPAPTPSPTETETPEPTPEPTLTPTPTPPPPGDGDDDGDDGSEGSRSGSVSIEALVGGDSNGCPGPSVRIAASNSNQNEAEITASLNCPDDGGNGDSGKDDSESVEVDTGSLTSGEDSSDDRKGGPSNGRDDSDKTSDKAGDNAVNVTAKDDSVGLNVGESDRNSGSNSFADLFGQVSVGADSGSASSSSRFMPRTAFGNLF